MGFLLFVLAVVVLVHLYLYRRLVHDTAASRSWRAIGLLTLTGLVVLTMATFGLRRVLGPEQEEPLHYTGFVWLAFALYAVAILAVFELPRLVVWSTRRLRRRPTDPRRRRFLARVLAGGTTAVAAGTVGYGVAAARPPRVVRRDVILDTLDPALDGFTIAALSDIHLGPINDRAFLADVVRTVNAARPDLVALVGDLVDGSVAELGGYAAPLRELTAPSYFVTGNHEYFVDVDEWLEYLSTLGVRVLRNERVAVGRRGAGGPTFDLAGIDDRTAASSGEPGHGADLDAALAGRDPDRAVVLLAHQPVMVDRAARAGVDLQISGHTHGGQFLPLGYVVLLDQPVLAGLTRVGRTWLYVTRGVGFWGPPVRVGAPPEITLLTLRAG